MSCLFLVSLHLIVKFQCTILRLPVFSAQGESQQTLAIFQHNIIFITVISQL